VQRESEINEGLNTDFLFAVKAAKFKFKPSPLGLTMNKNVLLTSLQTEEMVEEDF
jgi:hypothetical protein